MGYVGKVIGTAFLWVVVVVAYSSISVMEDKPTEITGWFLVEKNPINLTIWTFIGIIFGIAALVMTVSLAIPRRKNPQM